MKRNNVSVVKIMKQSYGRYAFLGTYFAVLSMLINLTLTKF